MLPALMAGGAAAGVAGGIIGNIASAGDRRAARNAISEAVGEISRVKVPTADELKITLQKLQLQGQLTPELEQEILQDPSKLLQIHQDQQLKQTQLDYLKELKTLGKTGLTPEERAELNKQRLRQIADTNARDQAILQNIAARGGSVTAGNEMAQRLLASQQSSQNAQEASDNLMAQAYRRALEAKTGAANLAQQLDTTDYSRQADLARAQDEISRFNVGQRSGVQQRNVGTKMDVQGRNLSEKQRISDSNVGLSNEQEKYNKQTPIQVYNMAMQRAQALANAKLGQASALNNQAQQTAGMWAGIGGGISQGISGIQSGTQQSNLNDAQINYLKSRTTYGPQPKP